MEEYALPSPSEKIRGLVVSDFDGTMTGRDFFDLAWEQIDQSDLPDYWGEHEAGERSHFSALQEIYNRLQGGEKAIAALAEQAQLDPALPEAIERLRQKQWDVLIVSAGCTWYIEYLLALHDVQKVTVISNPGRVRPDGVLEMCLPRQSPFFSEELGVDKLAVVRWAQQHFEEVAYIGDSRTDELAARQVPADRRFARGKLAGIFKADRTPFQFVERWSQLAELLPVAGEDARRGQ